MARLLSARPNTAPVDATNPHGTILDESGPGQGDGTNVNEAVNGDLLVFFQKLMAEAGVVPNELPDNTVNGFQLFDAFQLLISQTSGGGGSNPEAEEFSSEANPVNLSATNISLLSQNRVAVLDGTRDELITFDFDGANFNQVGNATNIGVLNTPKMVAISPTRIATIELNNDQLIAYEFDGTDWAQVGNPLNVGGLVADIVALEANRIVMLDRQGGTGGLRAFDFDGTNWSAVGTDLVLGLGFASGTYIGGNQFVIYGSILDELRTYSFDGSNFTQVGNSLNIGGLGGSAMTALTGTRIVMFNQGNTQIRFYDFNGTDFAEVGQRFENAESQTSVVALSQSLFAALGQSFFRTYIVRNGSVNPF